MSQPTAVPRKQITVLVLTGIAVVVLGLVVPKILGIGSSSPNSEMPPVSNDWAASAQTGSPLASMARIVIGIGVTAGFCIAAARWWGNRKTPVPTGVMEVLAATPIDLRSALYLVRAGDRRMLIGTDPLGVKALLELPRSLLDPAPPPSPGVSASTFLGPKTIPLPPTDEEITQLLARLRGNAR